MKMTISISGAALLAWSVVAPAVAGTFPTFCGIMPYLRDNLTVKADVPDGKLRIDKEGSFRVYLCNTMSQPFCDAQLRVLSDQFDAEVTPSPTWKTFPDVPAAAGSGAREYFTVALKRKSGVPDGAYDISLKVYSSRVTYRRLAAVTPLVEALDEHTVPAAAAIAVDGRASPSEWADGLLIKNFLSYKVEGRELKSHAPAAPTRVHMTADPENLYLLVLFMQAGPGDDLRLCVAPGMEDPPKIVTLDAATGKLTADVAMDGAKCARCQDESLGDGAVLYEVRIPRQALGVDRGDSFFANFCRRARLSAADPKPECSYWRGNDVSVNDPVVYGRMTLASAGKGAAAPAVAATADMPSVKDNVVVKADLTAAGLRSADGKSFRVYVQSTLKAALTNLALQVLSDRFDATVSPSPAWTNYPDLTPGAKNGFTVTLKARKPSAGTASDAFLRLTAAAGQTRQLLAYLPLAEAIDDRVLPLGSAVTIDGKATPREWANTLALTGLLPYKKEADQWRSGTPALTRMNLTADKENLYLLVTFMAVSDRGTLKFSTATGMDATPAWVAIERATGRITSSVSTNGMTCRRCDDDPLLIMDPKDPFKVQSATTYELQIPRKSLGLDQTLSFLANVESGGAYWRGNPASAADPVTYGRFSFGQ